MTSDLRQHERETLSALFDGELKGDAARFALKRLEHDRDWRDAVERWQVAGDALRGQASALLPDDFASRVCGAIAAEPTGPTRHRRLPARWLGGTALAASLAALVLFMAQRTPGGQGAPQSDAAVVAVPADTVTPRATPPKATAPLSGEGTKAVAVSQPAPPTSLTERAATTRRRAAVPAATEAVVASAAVSPKPSDPFTPTEPPVSRPWPRAVLPQYGSGQNLTAGFGTARSLHPFEPRLPEDDQAPGIEEPSR